MAKSKGGRPTDYISEYSKECPAPTPGSPQAPCVHIVCHMREGKSLESWAAKVGHYRQRAYDWEEEHEEFADAVKRGRDLSLLWWENLMQSGTGGQLRSVASEEFDSNGKVKKRNYKKAQFHPVGAIFTMKNRFPTLYRDRIDLRHSDEGDDESLSDMTLEELRARNEALNAKIKKYTTKK